MTPQLIYLAGPYRAKNGYTVRENVRTAERFAVEVVQLGHYPVTPHLNTAFFDGEAEDEYFLAHGLALLSRCDAILLLPRWEQSSGSRQELADAHLHGLEVYKGIHEIPEVSP